MKKSGYNLRLKRRRKELGYSLKEAAVKLNIFILLLFFYEKGYFLVKPDYYQQFIDVYGLPEDFFENDLFYPEEEKEEPVEFFLMKYLRKLIFNIVCGVVLLGSIAMIVCGNAQMNYSTDHVLSYYNQQTLSIREKVMQGEKIEIESIPGHMLTKTYYPDGEDAPSDKAVVGIAAYDYESRFKFTTLGLTRYFYDDVTGYILSISNSFEGTLINVIFQESKVETEFTYNNGEFKVNHVLYELSELNDQNPQYFIYAGLGLTYAQDSLEFLNLYLKEVTGKDYTVNTFFQDLKNGTSSYDWAFGGGVILMVFGGIFLGSSTFFLIFALIIFINKKHQLNILENKLADSDEDITSKEKQSLKKNFSFPFVVPEFIIRIAIIVLVLLSSIATYALFSYFLGLVGIGGHKDFSVAQMQSILNFYKIASNFICIATIMSMFIKIDIFIKTRGYIKYALQMFFAGLLFYIAETLIVYAASSGLNNLAIVTIFFADYLPGNIFWGMGVYALFAMFLFSTPKLFQSKKGLRIMWKSFALIPFMYLFISMLYSCLTKAKVWSKVPYYFQFLLYPKGLIISLFTILFCIAVFIYRYITVKRYGQKEADISFLGSKYILYKNVVAVGLILVLGLIDLILYYSVDKTNVYVKALDLGKNYYILCAIPLLILYRPHLGSRNARLERLNTIAYGLSYSLSYILLAILFLPYISYLEPILGFLLE